MSARRRPNIWRALQLGALCCALAGAPGAARAQSPSIVLLGAKGTLSNQIEAELTGLGFRVLPLDAGESPGSPRGLQAAAREAGAEAAVSVQPSALGVEVWLVDRVTGKTLSREVVETRQGVEQERVIAVRVVELLRASLLELQLPSGAEGEVQATPRLHAIAQLPEVAPAGPREPGTAPALAADGFGLVRFEAGGGLSSSVGALAIAPLAALGVLWQPTERLAIGLSSFLPLASSDVSAPEGSVRVATWQVQAGPRIYPLARAGPLRPFIDLGLGLIWFQIDATRVAAPLIAASERLLTAGASAGLGAEWRLSSRFSLFSSAGASLSLAKPVVQFAGRDVVTLARPVLSWTLGIEYRATSEASRDW